MVDETVFEEIPFAEDNPSVVDGLAMLQKWMINWQGGNTDPIFDDIKSDYTRLFIGPEKVMAPPWESVYFSEERLVFQEQTLQVRNWYQRFGLASEKIYKEPDDHIALEISFIAHLASLSLEALEVNDQPTLAKTLQAQQDFLKEHLLQWGPKWCDSVIENARTDFYKGTALLLRGAFTELKQTFDLEVSR